MNELCGEVVMTVSEAAAVLRISRNAAYAAVKRGEIASIKIGRRILIPRPGIEKLLGVDIAAVEGDEIDIALGRFEARCRLWAIRGMDN